MILKRISLLSWIIQHELLNLVSKEKYTQLDCLSGFISHFQTKLPSIGRQAPLKVVQTKKRPN